MAIKASSGGNIKITEKLVVGGSKVSYLHLLPFLKTVLSGSTTPSISKAASRLLVITAGDSVAIDLRAIAHPSGTPVDFSGLAIKQFGVYCETGSVSFEADAGLKIGPATLRVGEINFRNRITDGEVVSGSNKLITFTAITNCWVFLIVTG